MKKEENNNTEATDSEREREERQSSDTLKVNIPYETHTYKLMIKSLELVNSSAMPSQFNDNVLK